MQSKQEKGNSRAGDPHVELGGEVLLHLPVLVFTGARRRVVVRENVGRARERERV